ncbi:hypothetical protein ES703_14946 [subsurface metagenome]
MSSASYVTLKVPKDFEKSIDVVRNIFLRKGIENMPPNLKKYLNSKHCPLCNKKMDNQKAKLIYRCHECGISKPVIDIDTSSIDDSLPLVGGKGTLVGLGIYALAKVLGEINNERRT